jgi:6-phosphogluconolactonase
MRTLLVAVALLCACRGSSPPGDGSPDQSPVATADASEASVPSDAPMGPAIAPPDAPADPPVTPDASARDLAADRPLAPAGNPFVYVGSVEATEIRIFELDLATGALRPRGSAPSGPSPDYLAFHPSGRFLYALNEVTPGRLVSFAVDPGTGALTRLNDVSSGGDGPAHLSVHRSGRWLLSSNYVSGEVAAVPIMPDGRLGPPVAPRFAGNFAHMIIDDGASGAFVFVPSKGDDRVLQFRFDDSTGRLEPNSPAFVAQAGAPRHLAFSRDASHAYLLTEAGRTLVSYRYDATTGLLSSGAGVLAAPSGDGSHLVLHPSRPLLYTSLRFFDSIALFTLDADGRPSAPRHFHDQIARPWDMSIDPTGRYLLVANNGDATIKVLRIDEQTGELSMVGAGAAVAPQPRFVGILPRPATP